MPQSWSSVAKRPDASMSLLREVVEGADDGYREAAAVHGTSVRPWWGRLIAVLLLLGLGVAAGQAIVAARMAAPEVATGEQRLRTEVDRQTAGTDELALSVNRIQDEVSALQTSSGALGARQDELDRLQVAAGTGAVHGSGILITLDDAPPPSADAGVGDPGPLQADDGRIHDRELQAVVNRLWAAGAEAISINGLRLTPRTAIREAGQAVLVDFRPLSPPYSIRAVGDADALQAELVASRIGRSLQTYVSLLGISYDVSSSDNLALPAGSNPRLRAVEVAGPPAAGSTTPAPGTENP